MVAFSRRRFFFWDLFEGCWVGRFVGVGALLQHLRFGMTRFAPCGIVGLGATWSVHKLCEVLWEFVDVRLGR